MKGFRLKWLLSCALLVSCLIGCTVSKTSANDPGPNLQSLPLFPQAQQVKIQSILRMDQEQVTSFQTQDTPEAVLEFYRTHLTQDGWDPISWLTPTPRGLAFNWAGNAKHPDYAINITITSAYPQETKVEVNLITFMSR